MVNLKYLISLVCIGLLMTGCEAQSSKYVSCKLAVGLPDHSQKSIHGLQNVISDAWNESNITGWTLYSAQGAWRPSLGDPFVYDTSVIIEVLGTHDLIQDSQTLGLKLEKIYQQDKVLVYCTPIISGS